MTPSPPDEALHFRGKTLTPESPRPLHIPEPANIPVLENQMDPVFNDTSTYQRSDYPQEPVQTHDRDGWSRIAQDGQDLGLGQRRDPGSLQGVQPIEQPLLNDMPALAAQFYPSHTAGTEQQVGNMNMNMHMNPNLAFAGSSHSHAPPVVPGPQGYDPASDIDNAGHLASSWKPDHIDEGKQNMGLGAAGVNFQTLLDNLSQPSATTANANPTGPAASSLAKGSSFHQAPKDESLHPGIPSALDAQCVDLPARPSFQDPSLPPNYAPSDENAHHQISTAPNTAPSSAYAAAHSSNNAHPIDPPSIPPVAPGTESGTGDLPPPPMASFQQQGPSSAAESQGSQEGSTAYKRGRLDKLLNRGGKPLSDDDQPWGPEVQKKYDEFLHDERIYVTEGLWDRFPVGSRLFVGNLPTERVTKRDMFHIFHNYGKLAQISIKQAYGFIQFLEASACHAALQTEQGALIRGRKIHLEISKPQRSTARPGPTEPPRAPPPRRSRSPEFSRTAPARSAARAPGDRYDRPHESNRLPFSDFRDEPSHRRRDDYRPPRSPSPRPFRARDGYRSRDRTPERSDRRERRRSRSPRSPRSPYARDRRYRSPSPRPRGNYEGEVDLPVPRRAPRDVPEVQILVLEEIDRNFILHVENAFRNRGLRVDVLVLGPRIPLGAAVHRQYVEGVLAVVRLSRPNQFSRKVPLQMFDRSAGPDNVRFTDYPELDPNIAAEVMFHQAQAMQRGPVPSFAPNPAFGLAPIQPLPMPHPPMPTLSNPPNIANLISTLDGPALQSLLSALQQRPGPSSQPVSATQSPFASPNPPPPADLASLLSSATRAPPMPSLHPQQPLPHPPYNLQHPNAPMVTDPNLLSLLAKGLGAQQPQGQAPVGSNVQNLMNHLAKWKQ
ncbi:putative arginine/serine-rich splicing factor [Penicillium brasilianum]|uniref:Putative arginine/serine-rich splicing factor n=1 Tax=Penicillium brasilianum TaxID=104259 RepID=A0A1S9RLZ3_PENBI|nr:putative arginine/serine-rich splicing factor [Penicillium brasilianum]